MKRYSGKNPFGNKNAEAKEAKRDNKNRLMAKAKKGKK